MTELCTMYSILILRAEDILQKKDEIVKLNPGVDERSIDIAMGHLVCGPGINFIKSYFDLSKYDLVFYDRNDGDLKVIKDNTSKFSVIPNEIQG